MDYLRISIVTPVLNGGRYLEETIRSVVDQGYPNLEYIIRDGGSKDNSLEIIKKYENRLHLWKSAADNGMYDGLNKGFEDSTGQIMGWINSDDVLMPKSLFILHDIFSELDSVEWISGMKSTINRDGRVIRVTLPESYNRVRFLHGRSTIQQESTFWRRSLWSRAGSKLDDSFKYAADVELWARFFTYTNNYRVGTILGAFRRHGNQISQNYRDRYHSELNRIRSDYKMRIPFYGLQRIINTIIYRMDHFSHSNPDIYYDNSGEKFRLIR